MLEFVQLNLAAKRLQRALKAAFAGILAGVGELRNHDRGQNPQNDHHDQDFDQRKSALRSGLT